MTLQITQTLTVPDSSAGRAAFVAAANSFGNNLTPWANQANAMAVEMNTNATAAATSKTGADTAKAQAEDARDAALAAASAIAADYNPASHAYAKNALAWDGAAALYRCILAYTSGATTPSADPAHWARVNLNPDDIAALQASVSALQTAANALLDVPTTAVASARALALGDRGSNLQASANITVPTNAAAAFPLGSVVVISNLTASAISIAPAGGVTLRLSGSSKTGTLTLAAYSKATVSKEAADLWFAGGSGLS